MNKNTKKLDGVFWVKNMIQIEQNLVIHMLYFLFLHSGQVSYVCLYLNRYLHILNINIVIVVVQLFVYYFVMSVLFEWNLNAIMSWASDSHFFWNWAEREKLAQFVLSKWLKTREETSLVGSDDQLFPKQSCLINDQFDELIRVRKPKAGMINFR